MAKEGKVFVRELTAMSEDYSQWYVDVVRKADLADYTDVRGCMVIKPYGYAIWENIQAGLDKRIKDTGHQNAYFPLFVPESFLKKEAEHVEGFAPEVPWVTHVGEEKLEERLAIRPTSEAIIGASFAKWIQSYRDLPVLINQWANVVRWEKRTRLFLRTSEFLWQEGHTCHRTQEEAVEETLKMLGVYHDFLRDELAMPTLMGKKTETEKFAGAVDTYSVEALMSDGWALQAGTSHYLGQNFARAFNIKFLDEDNTEKHVHQTSWGMTTRLIGATVMMHGDDSGLKLPPRVAPYQAVIVPILFGEATKAAVLEAAQATAKALKDAGVRVHLDARDHLKPGFKFNQWEMRGAPLRIEIGPKDVEKDQAVLVSRLDRSKEFCPTGALPARVAESLVAIQAKMLADARSFLEKNTRPASSLDELREIVAGAQGYIAAGWDGSRESEARVKEETKATIRCIPLEGSDPDGLTDLVSGKPAKHRVIFARAY